MKKTLVALAALASISAFAQSSVTFYGGLDTGIAKLKSDTGTTTTNRTYTGGNAGYTSRIGLKGEEDLGGGTTAAFNWEAALGSFGADMTNNAAFNSSQANGTRTATVTLTNASTGTLQAGYGMLPRHLMAATVAQNDYSLPGNISLAASQGGNGTNYGTTGGSFSNSDYTLRANTIAYVTPSYNGFSALAGVMYANNNTVTNATDAQKTNANAKAYALGATYASGPLSLLASTTKTTADGAVPANAVQGVFNADGTTTAGSTAVVYNPSTRTNNIVGGLYQLSNGVKIGYANFQDKLVNDVTATSDVTNKGNVISARGVISGPYEALALYSKGTYNSAATAATAGTRAQSGYQLAGFYNFSKRTAAYVAMGVQKRENAVAGSAETKDTMSTIGIRHNF